MARFRKIDPRIWNDSKFFALSQEAKLLFLYLLTSPAMTNIGALPMRDIAVAQEVGFSLDIPHDIPNAIGYRIPYSVAYGELYQAGIAEYDPRGLFWVKNFLKYNPPDSSKVVKSWATIFDLLPECPLLDKIIESAKTQCNQRGETYAAALDEVLKGFSGSHGKAMPKATAYPTEYPMAYTETYTETYTDTDTEKKTAPKETDEKPKSAKRSRKELAATMAKCPEGVKPDAWSAFLSNRKKKSMSEYALQLMKKQCELAGWTLADAIDLCVARTWEGFDAEWVKNIPKPAKRTSLDAEKEKKAAEIQREYQERAKKFQSANDESDLLAAIGG